MLGRTTQGHRGRGVALSGRRTLIFLATVPTITFYVLWVIVPMAYSFVMSFHDWNPLAADQQYLGRARQPNSVQ